MAFEKQIERELIFAPFIEKTLAHSAGLIQDAGINVFKMYKASVEDDMKKGFDFVFTMGEFTVPVRVRTPSCKFRDFTVRSQSRYAGKTEIHKLREGFGDVYFYGWTKWDGGHEVINQWWLINLKQLRASGLLDIKKPQTSNGDGTFFISYKFKELNENSCIINTYCEAINNNGYLLPFNDL